MSHDIKHIPSHPLWEYFSKVPEEPKKAICKQCSRKLSHKTTITNLKSHLERLHTAHYSAYTKKLIRHNASLKSTMNQPISTSPCVYLLPISSTSEHQIKYEVESTGTVKTEENTEESFEEITDTDTEMRGPMSAEEKKQIDARLLMFIVKSYQPVSIVEGRGFTQFLMDMNADYIMPERKDITKRILPEIYYKCLEEQKCIVQQGSGTYCLTIDRWTSVIYEDSLVAITAHFITPNYQFKSVLLKCQYCDGNSEDLQTVLTETCTEWNISGKINWCVTDDGEDIVQAINSLGWNHMGCMAYKLNRILLNSLTLIDETQLKVKQIVRYFNANLDAEQLLDEFQTNRGIEEPLELLDSERTSWTSRYNMIERFVTLQEAVVATIAERDDDADLPNILTNEDWSQLKQLCKLLKPFEEAKKELGADKYACASKVIALVNGLKDVLQELRKKPDNYCLIKEVVESIEKELNEQFYGIESDPHLVLCTILDPRYKTSMFIDESAADIAKSNLVSEVEGLMKDESIPTEPMKAEIGPTTANNEDGGEFSLWRRRTMILEKRLVDQSANHHRFAHQEVELYMQEQLADGNPCEWWHNNEVKFPHLAKLFKTICNKVATSVPSEQLFTEEGINLCERRNTLSLRKAEMIVFLHANLNDEDYIRFMPDRFDGTCALPV